MPFPKPPKGEKPQTTIRLQHRQIEQMSADMADLRRTVADQKSAIAAYDVAATEQEMVIDMLRDRNATLEHSDLVAAATVQTCTARLAYLEGYYAKSAETLTDDKAKTLARAGARTPRGFPHGTEVSQAERTNAAAPWTDSGTGR